MGEKGNKLGQESALTAALRLVKLSQIGDITSKKVFGGYGIFHDGKIFAIVGLKGLSYIKANDSIQADFEVFGSQEHSRMPYLSVPEKIFDDPKTLVTRAKKSIAI